MGKASRLKEEQIGLLEWQAKHSYNSFKKAVETRNNAYAVMARAAYQTLFGLLKDVTGNAELFRENDRVYNKIVDKYLLQYWLAANPTATLSVQPENKRKSQESTMKERRKHLNELKSVIDDGVMGYMSIYQTAREVANQNDFPSILAAIRYVRNS